MVLNDDELAAVYEFAYRLFEPKEIALAMGFEVEDFCLECQIQSSPISKKFYEGRMQQVAEIREQMIKAAKNGSNPAQEMLLDMLNHACDDIVI
ncbi:MAG: hypothetical protein MJZ00_07200 [Paludibacteraceae bacterium]|nr:hypothetical protein [Paludibacteraceae bacterium]